MIHYLQMPPEVLTDEHSVVVDIYTQTPGGGYDDDGNPIPPGKHYYVQDAEADLQPKSGQQRAVESATTYESTHLLILAPTDEEVPSGAAVDVKHEAGGEVRQSFEVVFVAHWGSHLEIDLKAV